MAVYLYQEADGGSLQGRLPNAFPQLYSGQNLSQKTTVSIVYRENSFYPRIVHGLAGEIERQGYAVNLRPFPIGTSIDSIAHAFDRLVQELRGSLLVLDNTVQGAWGLHHREDVLRNAQIVRAGTLDSTLFKFLTDALCERYGIGKSPEDAPMRDVQANYRFVESFGKCLENVFRDLFAALDKPNRIDVFPDELMCHTPWNKLFFGMDLVYCEANRLAPDTFRLSKDKIGISNEHALMLCDYFGIPARLPHQYICEWVRQGGYDGDIRVVADPGVLRRDDYAYGSRILVLGDRHVLETPQKLIGVLRDVGFGLDDSVDLNTALFRHMVLRFPIENLLEDLLRQAQLELGPDIARNGHMGEVAAELIAKIKKVEDQLPAPAALPAIPNP